MTQRLELVLWVAGLLGNGILFSVLMFRQHWRRFPIFTLLAGYEAVRSTVLFLIFRAGFDAAYLSVYWKSEFLDIALQVTLLVELGRTITSPRSAVHRSGLRQTLSLYGLGGAIFLAALCAMAIPALHGMEETLDMRASLFTSLITCELYLLIIRRVNRLKLERCRQALAISKGILVWSICVLTSDLIRQINGWKNQAAYFDEFRSVVVVMMLAYWSAFFWRTPPEVQTQSWPTPGGSLTASAYAGRGGS